MGRKRGAIMIILELDNSFLGEAFTLENALRDVIKQYDKEIKEFERHNLDVHIHINNLENCKSILKKLKKAKS